MTELSVPTPQEIATVAGFIAELEGSWRLSLHVEDGSPWLLIDLQRKDPHLVDERHELRLALWRFTLAVYPYEEDGEAVAEDPITPEELRA